MNSIVKSQNRAVAPKVSTRSLGDFGPLGFKELRTGPMCLKTGQSNKALLVRFRFGGVEDEQQMFEVESICFISRRLKSYLTIPSCASVLAFLGNQLIGYVAFSANENTSGAHIHSLAILPEMRGMGAASGLLNRAEALMKANGVATVSLYLRSLNTEAQKYYLRKDFKYVEDRPDHYGAGQDAIKMEKSLYLNRP